MMALNVGAVVDFDKHLAVFRLGLDVDEVTFVATLQ